MFFSGIVRQGVRYYYKRKDIAETKKSPINNAGNYFTLALDYQPPNTSFNTGEEVSASRRIGVIPSWGLRRDLGSRFVFEGHVGFGYAYFINHQQGNRHNSTLDVRLVIGYVFSN